jgi:copper chaperone NosL
MLKLKLFLSMLIIFSFLGCDKKVETGPAKINWDRDMCDRCVMVLSDRKNSVQLKDKTINKVYKFDDIGCMVLWFDEEKIAFKDIAEIWITDALTGEWINAREAFYTAQNVTPMAFGFSAYKLKESAKTGEEILTYEDVLKKIR